MNTPVIGITTRVRADERMYAINFDYVQAVERAGGIPILIPSSGAESARCVERLDGLLLPGGPDIDPQVYGGTMHEAVYGVNPARDAAEFAVLREAMRLEIPILGICRGAQLINVAHGGTLIEHLDETEEGIVHRINGTNGVRHQVEILSGTIVSEIVGTSVVEPISFHHQAVRDLGAGLKVAAVAPDGVIEGVVGDGYPFLVGVQWHPEMTAAEDPSQQAIFDAFVQAAQKRKKAA